MSSRVALVSCVKSKQPRRARAADLYISTLFKGLRAYAESVADEWYILSAEHGLLRPDQVVEPYEKTLNSASAGERRMWAERVQQDLVAILPPGSEIVMLAGQRYREYLVPFLRSRGFTVEIPLEGLPLGKQLQWLKSREASSA